MLMPNQLFQDEKVFVTDEGLDDWLAQMYNVSISNFPKRRPPGMPNELFERLKERHMANEFKFDYKNRAKT